jgi:hypothetical protein
MNKNKVSKIVLAVLLILMLVMTTSPALASANSNVALAGSCKTKAYPGSSSGLTHNKWLDVYPSNLRTDGIFIYYNPLRSGWDGVKWSSWGVYGSALRFGVGTSWSLTHPYWKTTLWYYVYPC